MTKENNFKKGLSKASPLIILAAVLALLHIFGILTWTRDVGAIEIGLINSLVVLALFLSYTMLNVCDLSTDGCYTLGAVVGGVVAAAGHPYLAILAAVAAGMISGFITSVLQTKMGVNSLLAGIIVNTGLYSINIVIMGGAAQVNIFRKPTVFSYLTALISGKDVSKVTQDEAGIAGYASLILSGIVVILVITFLSYFLKTKLGLAIHATGNNPDMVRSSSINPAVTTTIGLCISGAMTALSGCLFVQNTGSADINIGQGMVTMALASLLIGSVFIGEGSIALRAVGAVIGTIIFRMIYAIALALKIDTSWLKLVYSVIVVIAISTPYLKSKMPLIKRRLTYKKGGRSNG